MDRRWGGVLAVLVPMAFGLCTSTAAALDKVTFGTDWVAQAEHGGFYYAVTNGIYAKYGLEVEIKPGGPQVNYPQMLLAGKMDFIMLSNSLQPMAMNIEGAPVVAVAASFQKDPQCLLAHPEAGITSIAEMKGRPVLISAHARDSYWRFLEQKFGFTDAMIRPYTYSMAPFLADKATIQQGYATNEPFLAQQAGVAADVFLLADAGYTSYSALIGTRQDVIDSQPELVQRFVDASMEGWRGYMHGDPSQANALIKQHNPEITDALLAYSHAAMTAFGLVDSGDAKTLGIGAMSDARWHDMFAMMAKAGVYPADFDVKKAYTLQFVGNK